VVSFCANSSGDSFDSGLSTAKEALSLYGIFFHFILRFEVSRHCIDVGNLIGRHFAAIFIYFQFIIIRAIRPTIHAKYLKEKDQAGKNGRRFATTEWLRAFLETPDASENRSGLRRDTHHLCDTVA
jgi:hypothetical protein